MSALILGGFAPAVAADDTAADTANSTDESDSETAPDDPSTWFLGAGGDVWFEGAGGVNGGHGHVLVHWRWHAFPGAGRLDASLATDTLEVAVSGVELAGQLKLFGGLKGEFPFGAMLPDYYRLGGRDHAREFLAGYLRGRLGLEWTPGSSHFLKAVVQGRRWFFLATGRTADALRLPEEIWVFEPRLNYTYWGLRADSSQWQPHQPFWRVRGFAAGVQLGADVRSDTTPWGARGPSFTPPDPRNTPDTPVLFARQWAKLGVPVDSPWYVELSEYAGWGAGEDDLTRSRIGGLNAWVVPVAGLPWGVLVSGRYVTGRAALRWSGLADHEFGVFVDAGAVADVRRVGALEEFGPVGGAGLLADLRWGPWKADARLGWAYPFAWLEQKPVLSAWLSVGRRL